MQSNSNTAQVEANELAGTREWVGLAVLFLPVVLLGMDLTVLHLAVPTLSATLRPTSTELLWILDIYGFMIAGFLIVMGTLGDRIGRRRVLLGGATAFCLASILAAFSNSAEMLILSRALLGIAGATLMPSTLALISNMFKVDRQRTAAIAIWVSGFIVGTAIGPVIGGIMLEYFWWGSVFLLAVPVMALLLIAGPLLLPEFRQTNAGRLDLYSVLLCVIAMVSIIFGLKEIARNGFVLFPLVILGAGILFAHIFVGRQNKLTNPMLELGLFSQRRFRVSVTALLLTLLAFSSAWLMAFQYLQGVLNVSPFKAGLLMLPVTALQVIAAQLAPVLSRRVQPATVIFFGLLTSAIGFIVLATFHGNENATLYIIIGMGLMGVGIMPMGVLGTDLIVSSAPPEKAGSAASISETANELGMALGIALVGSVSAAVYRSSIEINLPIDISAEFAIIAADTLGGALSVAKELPHAAAAELLRAAQKAFIEAFQISAIIGAAICFGTALLALLFMKDHDSSLNTAIYEPD